MYLGSINTTQYDVVNASSQIVLFPTSTDASATAATIKGKVQINLRADDDTLGRRYANDYATASLKGTYLSAAGTYTSSFAGDADIDDNYHFSNPTPGQLSFNPLADRTVFAYPDLPTSSNIINNLDEEDNGYITSMAYKGAIISTKTDAAGNYTLVVPASARGLNIRLEVEKVVTGHAMLTTSAGNLNQGVGTDIVGGAATGYEVVSAGEFGSGNEIGSQVVEYKAVQKGATVVTGTTITMKKLRVVTHQYEYVAYLVDKDGESESSSNVSESVKAGQVYIQSVYLLPNTPQVDAIEED
ncbi:MAG: hypothetical protein H7Z75_04945 [Ferruginibacter sp.]|nr:hypothetical protein [Cytophagales bacterium]